MDRTVSPYTLLHQEFGRRPVVRLDVDAAARAVAAEVRPPPDARPPRCCLHQSSGHKRARRKSRMGMAELQRAARKRRPDLGGAGQPTSRRRRSRRLGAAALRRDRCLGRPTPSLRHRLRRHDLNPFRQTTGSSPSTTAAPPSRSSSIGEHLPSSLSTAAAPFGPTRVAPCSSRACRMTEDDDRFHGRANLAPYLDRTRSIQRLTRTQGWTVCQIPSTPGCRFVYLPPLVVAATPRSAACRGSRGAPLCSLANLGRIPVSCLLFAATASDESLLGAWSPRASYSTARHDVVDADRFFWRVSTVLDVED
ncbi:hypothetical protein PVAP13_7NG327644 [Panicum virgatum]|uniref:Uncharacterized protein n=1 Tax=Panicum virgatum TaxID=38727 RepID=A0A8T0Q0U0_PANVG|nr:hypothetical protein PVAP13_7NG327644 [Panicum virgatum]